MIVACISLNGWWMRELDVSQAKHGCESSLEFLCVCWCVCWNASKWSHDDSSYLGESATVLQWYLKAIFVS